MANTPSRFSFSRQGLPILALIGLIVAAAWIWVDLPQRSTIEPEQQPAKATGELAEGNRVAGAGVVEPSSEVISIGTAVSGLVTDVRVTPGEQVAKGQPLFIVDGRSARARVTETRAAIGEAQAAIKEAQTARATANRQLALYRQIDDPAAISQAELIRAEGEASAANSRLELARARLSAARAALSSAETELGRLTVRAPISGEILNVAIRPGEYVSTMGGNLSFIEMGQTQPMHVRVDIDEDEAIRIAAGKAALVSARGDAGNQVKAAFLRAEPQVVPKRSLTNSAAERVDVRVLQLIYVLPDDTELRVGQQVDAFIPARDAQEDKQP